MNYFTCDACHYIFQSDSLPPACPACGASSVTAHNGGGRRFQVPAVRLSTETETAQYRMADTEEAAAKSYLELVRGLPGYNLTDDEYHTALMLLFYFRSAPKEFTSVQLDSLLCGKNFPTESGTDEASARDLYTKARKHFVSQLGRERRETGCNDAVDVASYTEKGSAASLLIRFRPNEMDQILGKTPNLTNIRNVKFDQVIKKPSEGYIRFLTEWYNSVRG